MTWTQRQRLNTLTFKWKRWSNILSMIRRMDTMTWLFWFLTDRFNSRVKTNINEINDKFINFKFYWAALISPICIPLSEPEKSRDFVGYTPFAAGWGRTQEGGKSANVLQEIQLPVVSNSECKASYAAISKVASEKQFDNAVICAGYKEGGRGNKKTYFGFI